MLRENSLNTKLLIKCTQTHERSGNLVSRVGLLLILRVDGRETIGLVPFHGNYPPKKVVMVLNLENGEKGGLQCNSRLDWFTCFGPKGLSY